MSTLCALLLPQSSLVSLRYQSPFLSKSLFHSIPYPFLIHLPRWSSLPSKCTPRSSRFHDSEEQRYINGSEKYSEDEEEADDDDDDYEDEEEDDEEVTEEYDDSMLSFQQSEDDNDDEIVLSSWSEESKKKKVDRLQEAVNEFGCDIIDADELASIYGFRIDKFQRLAVGAFLRGSSVVVSAPTSSGKTLIAEAAAIATVAKGRRIFYTTPLKALSNQKFRDFRDTFGDEKVGLLTGDSAINKEGQVLVMTTEILRNMMYNSIGMASTESRLFCVDVIVLDEVHFLSDISRGTVWEEIVIYCPKDVQLICLSATVKNPDELAGWINEVHGKTELVTSLRRPVPLTWHFSTKANLFPLLEEKGKHMNRKISVNYLQLYASSVRSYEEDRPYKRNSRRRRGDYNKDGSGMNGESLSKSDISRIRRSQVPLVFDTLTQLKSRDMLPVVWFIFNRRGCDAAVQYIEGCKLLDECEVTEVELALKRFSLQNPDAVRESALKGLRNGVAAHHAGCLPLWKYFIEELFQRGLIKVVFATETLAAGMNMPARTAVISSLSKRTGNGRTQLSPNELLQMAGRAGRRGIDKKGHVVLIQTPNEGAEECCNLLFSGMEPLVSQFTASYGMVLNLLAGTRVTSRLSESNEMKALHSGRTLQEARTLVEKSFGTYLGSNVMIASKEELGKIDVEIQVLTSQISDDSIDKKSRQLLSDKAYREVANLQVQLRDEKRIRSNLRQQMERERVNALKIFLNNLESGHLPFLCLHYRDSKDVEHIIPAVYLGKADSVDFLKANLSANELSETDFEYEENSEEITPCHYVALGSDNSWYLFTEKWIKAVYMTGFPNVALALGDVLPRDALWRLLSREEKQWDKLATSEFGDLSVMEGSLDTWSWSLNVPILHSLTETDEVKNMSKNYDEALEQYKEQRSKVSRLKKRIARTDGFKDYKKIMDWKMMVEDKIRRLRTRSKRLMQRISEIEPSGWKEFVKISNVVHECRALDINTQVIFPLGETAAAIRGENELWLAMVLRNRILLTLKPAQLAAVFASVVSEGIKVRPWGNNSYIYEPSAEVLNVINVLDEQRCSLLELQEKHGVNIPCCLDSQFSGMVEAWASGLTWRELMMECAMDDGDLARLLRRTIDVLTQVPKLPDIDPVLQSNARTATNIMDRSPISELAG